MSEIKCLENYKRLREMLLNGYKGDADFFSKRLNISKRSFFRLVKYLKEIENLSIQFNKNTETYYLE